MPDNFDQIAKAIQQLAKKKLLVGIPMETSTREQSEFLNMVKGGTAGTISNASLGYIHEFGSPARNIPARPHLRPGVEAALPQMKSYLQAAANAALRGSPDAADQFLADAGQAAVNSVQEKIRALPHDLAQSTVTARRLRRPDIHFRERIRIVELEQARRDARKAGRKLDANSALELANLKKTYGLKRIYLREATDASEATPLIDTGDYMRSITYVIR
jgi:hypothetical protein